MPEQVQHWHKIRDIGSQELKDLIEKQIISTAYQVFGDFKNKILLSLPSENKAKGSINIGTIIYDNEKWPLGISTKELTQHMVILGRSGAGKTNVTFHILSQLINKKIPFVFMDWKRTVRHLIPNFKDRINIYTPGTSLSKFPFNPFVVPPGIESNVYVNQLIDVMSQAFTLGDGSKSILRKCIATLYEHGNLCPTVKEIIVELEKMPATGRMHGWKITAMRALESLEFADISSKDRISQDQLAEKMLNENTVIELDSLAQESKKFLIPILCLWLYYVRLKSPEREQLKLVLFIEEAHHVLHKHIQTANETILEMLFRQCRELGIGIIVIDQHPHLLSSAAFGNTYTTIFLNQKDPADINKSAAVCLLDADEKKYFSMLPVGQGIIKLQDRWTSPVHVQFPLVNIHKGSVTDDLLARYSNGKPSKMTHSPWRNFIEPVFDGFSRIPPEVISEESALKLIHNILTYPQDGIRERYRRLGFGDKKGNRLKEQLLNHGWIESQIVELGQTRKVLLRLTRKAKEALGIENEIPEYGSLVHEYWKHYWCQRFKEQGYQVTFEVPRKSGSTDVVAIKNGEKIAIEIETGKSDVIWNVRQDLLFNYDKVLVVATDEKALKIVEEKLARAGLIIPGRVEIVLRDGLPRW